MKITRSKLKEIEKEVIKIAKGAGNQILKHKSNLDQLKTSSKESQGMVSEADFASETFIIKKLLKKYPEIPVLAEETYYKEFKESKHAYEQFKSVPMLWIIDPLDGTNNFIHGLDYFAVCISLVVKGNPVLGVVYSPERKELFYASQGNGMFYRKGNQLGDRVFQRKGKKELRNTLLATGFATEKGKPFNDEFKKFKKMMCDVRAIRRMGSAALDLCYVATGIYDGFWEKGLAPWDMAAAAIICREAGVKVTEYNGQKNNPFSETIVAGRGAIHKKVMDNLAE
jgi:myo-inositol-1(or 4)-monophosphatase